MDENTIQQKVDRALNELSKQDAFLLEKDANERSISYKLATYLQRIFEEWDVDCEYNRDNSNLKMIKELARSITGSGPQDEDAHTVYPDIIVHQRGKSGDEKGNLLVIEVKKSTNRDDGTSDKKKLMAYKQQLGYQHALFLRIHTGKDFAKGEQWYEKKFVKGRQL